MNAANERTLGSFVGGIVFFYACSPGGVSP